MNPKRSEILLTFEIPKPSDFKNPFLFYFPGCSKNLIENMNPICPICYRIIIETIVFPDSCSHAFCMDCLSKWKNINSSCPICRKPFKSIK